MDSEWTGMERMRMHSGRGSIFLTITVMVICLGGFQAGVMGDAASSARRAIQAAYDRMDRATARKDVRGATAYYAPNFAEIEPRGSENRAQKGQDAQSFFASSQSIHAGSTIQSIAVQGGQANVVVRRLLSFVNADVDAGTGQRDRWVLDTLAQDTWIKERSGWRWMASKRLSARETENGQPFRPHHGRRPA